MIMTFAFIVASAAPAAAQWSTTYEQFYLPGSFNWAFRNTYPAADRLFNAFDYGHAILYERLYTKPGAPVSILEQNEYDFITKKLLTNPPHVPLEEAAIEVAYAKIAPEAKAMFDWAHLLHRQIYDVWSDERLAPAAKGREGRRAYSILQDAARSGFQLGAEEHGPDGGPVLLDDFSQELSEVQWADLGVSLAPGRFVRATAYR